jgi:hypothetical protein
MDTIEPFRRALPEERQPGNPPATREPSADGPPER